MKKILTIVAATAVFASMTNTAISYPNFQHKHQHNFQQKAQKIKAKHDGICKELNLSKEQQQKMNEFRAQKRAELKPIFEKMKQEKQKLHELKQSNAAKNSINSQREKIQKLRAQKDEIKAKYHEKIKSILNTEQQKKYDKLMNERQNKMKNFQKKHKNKFNMIK